MAGQLLSPSTIGDVNRSRVLQALCDRGPMSRAELAKLAGVTRATIGNIVQSLIDGGVLEEGAPETGTGRVGKPGRPVWFGRTAGLTAAVAVSPSAVEAALVNARGEVLDEAHTDIDATIDDTRLASAAATLLAKVTGDRDDLLGIGVAIPGVCDPASGAIIGSGQLPKLRGNTLSTVLASRTATPVLLDNDSRAQALAEKWFGEGRGLSTFVSVHTGHGLGAGIVIGGSLFRGEGGLNGEIGHTCVDPDGPWCRCGLRGCWETVATLRWLRAEARRNRIPGAADADSRSLVATAAGGGAGAKAAADLLDRYAANLAIGLANVGQLLNPETIILHGDVVGGGEDLRARIEANVVERSLAYLRPTIRVVLSRIDRQATLLGAAGLVLSETFNLAT